MSASEHQYQELPHTEIADILREFQDEIEYFMHYVLGYPEDVEYVVCGLDLIDAIIRVDKRQHYFRVFHGMDINDCKKAALFAYWFVKLRPIKITDSRYINVFAYNTHVNEWFAVHCLLSALCAAKKVHLWDGYTGAKDVNFEHTYIEKLRYSFRFRNFTIDSMIVLADTITTETFLKADKN